MMKYRGKTASTEEEVPSPEEVKQPRASKEEAKSSVEEV
jgi:hypothetical protein